MNSPLHLKELYLDGWMSYTDLTLSLEESGTTLIRGNVGSGKSGILEAIYYLLFGKTLRSKDTINDFINKITNDGYDIKIILSKDKNEYIVQEIRDRKNKGLYFYKNGERVSGKTDPETRKIIVQEWGMSAEDFRSIAFLGQRQSQILVEGQPAERANAIVDIYGLNKYDSAISSCDGDIKELSKDVGSMTTLLEKEEIDLESLEENLLDDAKDPSEIQTELETTTKRLEKFENRLEELRESTKTIYSFIQEMESKKKRLDRIGSLQEEITSLTNNLKKYNSDLAYEDTKNKLDALKSKIYNLQQKIQETNARIEKAAKVKNECPINNEDCPLNIPSKYKKEILGNAKEEKAEHESSLLAFSDKSKKCREILVECEARDSIVKDIEKKESIIAGIDEKEIDIEKLENKKIELEELNNKLSIGKSKTNDLRNKQIELNKELSEISASKSMQERANKALSLKRESIKKLKDQLNTQSEELQYLSASLALLKKMKMYKIDLVLQTLNENIKDILNNISDGEYKAEFVSQKLTADKKKVLDKVSIIVHDNYKSMPIEVWSGGQMTEVGLAVLLSVWKTAHTLSDKGVTSLWLDEVFGPLDENIINRVFDAVKSTAEELGAGSIKIISHRDLDERLFDHIWDVSIESGITTIEEK